MGKESKSMTIALLLILLPSAAATTISIGGVSVEPGETSAAPITIEDVTSVGTVDITVFYNHSVVHVTNATNTDFDWMYPVINNSAGYVRIGGMAYGDGLSGDVKLADLMLEAVGDAGETCSLGIIINELKVADANETTIPADVENSTFAIIDPPEPPANFLNTTGCHWINWTWTTGSNSDFVEVRINGVWVENCTKQYYNSTFPPHATRTISLRGYNSSLNKYSTCLNQTTTIPDHPPVAAARSMHRHNNAGSVYSCKAILDASESSDPDGSIAHHQWSFGDGTSGTGELAEHVYSSCNWNGTGYDPFIVGLTVTDDLDPLIEDTTTIPVNVYIAGDANADGRTNILDATLVGLEWGDTCTDGWGENEQADRADLNNDCRVNILDAVIIGTCWGNVAS
ncbi:MAG: PKD domain-containing protein [Euryarchaeota archaeon]|nr:PKD domain-containing protein [Euryarchaeota archaeon]